MSLTYSGAIVMVLGWIFQWAGVPFVAVEAEVAAKFIIEVIGVFMVLYGRFRAGGLKWYGTRKFYPPR